MTKQATKKTEDTPEFPAGKKQADMGEVMRALKPARQAKPDRFMRQQHAFNIFHYAAMAGTELGDHLAPIFWLQLCSKLRPLDEIVVTEELGAWRARLLVRSVGPDGLDLLVLNQNEIGGTAPLGRKTPLKGGLHIQYTGTHSLWAVYDGEMELVSHLPTEIAATEWLENNDPGAMA